MKRIPALALLSAPLVGAFLLPAQAQHNHQLGHDHYKGWENKKGRNCCNKQDCGELKESEVRENGATLEVHVEGQWCPVQPWMYLSKGKSPDWSKAHACVLRPYVDETGVSDDTPPCERLICFTPLPGI